MDEKVQEALIELTKNLNWRTQSRLTVKEDELAKRHAVFVSESLDSIKRYLALCSLPFIISSQREKAEERGAELLQKLWREEYPHTDMIDTLVRRPHNPTGNLKPTYMIIGDAPGVGEGAVYDRVERMFTRGPSSHMLRQALITNNMYYECWFTNLIRLSTPKNRPTSQKEVRMFLPFLSQEIKLLQPSYIILLGNHVSDMFDLFYSEYRDAITVTSVYHPSYICRFKYTPEEYGNMIKSKILLVKGK